MNIESPGNSDYMQVLMQILMQGMDKQLDLSKKMISINVENEISSEKMAIAEQIIDVYA